MRNCNLQRGKEGVGIPEVYAIATTTRGEDEMSPITAQEFIYKHAKTPIVARC